MRIVSVEVRGPGIEATKARHASRNGSVTHISHPNAVCTAFHVPAYLFVRRESRACSTEPGRARLLALFRPDAKASVPRGQDVSSVPSDGPDAPVKSGSSARGCCDLVRYGTKRELFAVDCPERCDHDCF